MTIWIMLEVRWERLSLSEATAIPSKSWLVYFSVCWHQVQNEVGRCGPVSAAYNGIFIAICNEALDGLVCPLYAHVLGDWYCAGIIHSLSYLWGAL